MVIVVGGCCVVMQIAAARESCDNVGQVRALTAGGVV
jgi:hypothetical protein